MMPSNRILRWACAGGALLMPIGFVFAFTTLHAIIFVSSFFTALYHFASCSGSCRSWRTRWCT